VKRLCYLIFLSLNLVLSSGDISVCNKTGRILEIFYVPQRYSTIIQREVLPMDCVVLGRIKDVSILRILEQGHFQPGPRALKMISFFGNIQKDLLAKYPGKNVSINVNEVKGDSVKVSADLD